MHKVSTHTLKERAAPADGVHDHALALQCLPEICESQAVFAVTVLVEEVLKPRESNARECYLFHHLRYED